MLVFISALVKLCKTVTLWQFHSVNQQKGPLFTKNCYFFTQQILLVLKEALELSILNEPKHFRK